MPRPISYDETSVVQAALEQFWQHGFSRSSVDAIVDSTGLNKHSLYQAFGGKNGLFLRALEQYLLQYSHSYLSIFDEQTGYAALHCYFQAVLRKPDPRGCLVANTAVEMGDADPDCQRLLAGYYKKLGACFAKAIREGQNEGHIRSDLNPRDTAQWLVRATQGIAVGNRLNAGPAPHAATLLALLAA